MFNSMPVMSLGRTNKGHKMKTVHLLAGILLLFIGLLPYPAVAESNESEIGDVDAMEFKNTISDFNRLKPLQNPRYEQSEEILDRRILDSKNKTIGVVKDVIFDTRNGRVKSLYVDFDRLRLRQAVYLDYDQLNIESVSTGYKMGFAKDEIKSLYPALLSSIETAAGETADYSKYINLETALGSQIVSSNGTILGTLEDVLFNDRGKYVRAFYLNINYSTIHNEGVAVPLSIVKFEDDFGKTKIIIDEAYIDTILEMAKDG